MSKEKQQQRKLHKIDRDLSRLDRNITRLKERQVKLVAQRGLLQSQLAQLTAPSAKAYAPGQQELPANEVTGLPPGQQKQEIELPALSWEQVQQCAAVIASDVNNPKNAEVVDLLGRIHQYTEQAAALPAGPEKDEVVRLMTLAMSILTEICRWAVYNGQVNIALTNPETEEEATNWLPILAVVGGLAALYAYSRRKK